MNLLHTMWQKSMCGDHHRCCAGCCLITNKAYIQGSILIVASPFWMRAFYK